MEIITKLGKHSVRVEGENLKSCMEQLGLIGDLPDKCPVCETLVGFYHKTTKDDDTYMGLRCSGDENGERHELTFGQHKKGDGLFLSWKARWRVMGTGKLAHGQTEPEGGNGNNGSREEDEYDQRPRGNQQRQTSGKPQDQYDQY